MLSPHRSIIRGSPERPEYHVPSSFVDPVIVIQGRSELINWQRASLLSLCLSVVSMGTAAASLFANYQTYTAQNTSLTLTWTLYGCYSRPTGAAGGATATVCDSSTPFQLVGAAIACDVVLLLALCTLVGQAARQYATGYPSHTEWALFTFRCLGVPCGLARCACLAAAIALKDSELMSYAAWSSKDVGWRCIVAALCVGCAQIITLALLTLRDTYVSENVRDAATYAAQKEMAGRTPRSPPLSVGAPKGRAQYFAEGLSPQNVISPLTFYKLGRH